MIGETIRAQVTWSQPVRVSNGGSNDNVFLRLDVGADDGDLANSLRKMAYVSGSGTDTLTFEYTVQTGDQDPDGVRLQTGRLGRGGVPGEPGRHPGRQPRQQRRRAHLACPGPTGPPR